MSRYQRHIALLLGIMVLFAVGLVGLNAWIDPFADFTYLTGRPSTPPLSSNNFGERKYKAALIEGLPANSIAWGVFGNSRATAIDISKGVPGFGGMGVNFAFGAGNLDQIREFIQTARSRHPDLRPIVATNLDHCKEAGSAEFLYLGRKSAWESRLDAVSRLVSIRTLAFGFWILWKPRAHSEVEMMPMGHNFRYLDATEAKIMGRIREDIAIYSRAYSRPSNLENCLPFLQAIRRENPSAVILINPISKWMLEASDRAGRAQDRARWVDGLKKLGPVINFTCARKITDRWQNYADAHHYRLPIGALILKDVGRFLQGRPLETGCLIGT